MGGYADGMTDRNTEALLWMLERSPELQKALSDSVADLLNDAGLSILARAWMPGDEA